MIPHKRFKSSYPLTHPPWRLSSVAYNHKPFVIPLLFYCIPWNEPLSLIYFSKHATCQLHQRNRELHNLFFSYSTVLHCGIFQHLKFLFLSIIHVFFSLEHTVIFKSWLNSMAMNIGMQLFLINTVVGNRCHSVDTLRLKSKFSKSLYQFCSLFDI